jgi:hypothetical protein
LKIRWKFAIAAYQYIVEVASNYMNIAG